MSLVENLVNQISLPKAGVTGLNGINLEDDVFAKLLEKQSEKLNSINAQESMFGQLGMPAGFQIESIDGPSEIMSVNNIQPTEQKIDIKDMDVGDFFSSLLNDNKDVMRFAQKHASNAYQLFNKGFVEDIADFASDIAAKVNLM